MKNIIETDIQTYTAIFDHYDFNHQFKKIIVKHVTNDHFYISEAYINALSVPELIGRLIYGQVLTIECESIMNDEIKCPIIKERYNE